MSSRVQKDGLDVLEPCARGLSLLALFVLWALLQGLPYFELESPKSKLVVALHQQRLSYLDPMKCQHFCNRTRTDNITSRGQAHLSSLA